MEYYVTIGKYYSEIEAELEKYEDYISVRLKKSVEDLYYFLEEFSYEIKNAVAVEIRNLIKDSHIYTTVWLYSFLIHLTQSSVYLTELLQIILKTDKLRHNTKYFLYYQIKAIIFDYKSTETEETLCLKWRLLESVYQDFKRHISLPIKRIQKEDRNKDLALVITEQFLVEQHGPTKTVMDRCYTLMKKVGKEVLLINTAEILSEEGEIPFLLKIRGSYNDKAINDTYQYWKGQRIPYIQCENRMPDIPTIELLLRSIYDLKPDIVISIGGSSILAGFVNEFIPVLTVGLTSSGITETLTDFQTSEKNIPDMHIGVLKKMLKSENHVIPGIFTFSLKEKTEYVSRKDVGLPENVFLLTVVGARLDIEITQEFLVMLQHAVSRNINVVFIGKFDGFHSVMNNYPYLKDKSFHLDFVDDILSRLALCDLYVNPMRKGGGTSCVEAMAMGKPVISIDYGDVAGIVGKDFCCIDYDEMVKIIQKYYHENTFYQKKSQEAKALADRFLDTETEFERIINEYVLLKD